MAGNNNQQQQQQQTQQPQQQQQQQPQQNKKPPLSCTSCRARKLKCDKQDPCRNCVRSGSECVFPARKRIQRPRKTKNAELLQRLHRLESIVGRVGGLANANASLEELEVRLGGPGSSEPPRLPLAEADTRADARETVSTAGLVSSSPSSLLSTPAVRAAAEITDDSGPYNDDSHAPPGGLKVIGPPQDRTASRYLSGEFWSSLCDEVGGLRQVLEQSTDSDDEDDDDGTSPESVGCGGVTSILTAPGMLLGTRQQRSNLHVVDHPSPEHIHYLALVYFRNVDVHLKILHRPTILTALSDLSSHPETASDLSPEQTALFFAIYYAAITTLTSAECLRSLGRPRADLAALYTAGVEQALLRADYLNSTSLATVQALTLYTCCLRSHPNGSRASWALLGLPIRLAQALGMHRDGDGDGRLSPFEAEQRRRLWWQLIVLDIRAAEDRGTGTVIARGSYDTRLPHNIDDAEFGPDTTAPLRDRPGPSDATFGLFTAQSSGIFLWSEHARQNIGEEETVRRARLLEEQFVKGADPEHVGSYLASVTVRLIILKMWLVMRYPLHPRATLGPDQVRAASVSVPSAASGDVSISVSGVPGSAIVSPFPTTSTTATTTTDAARRAHPTVSRQATLRTAVSIIELSEFLETGPYSDRFRWWSETYVQWHPLAVALAELCTQTEGDTVEHAWRVIEDVFPHWSDRIADAKRGSLWRPLRKLYKKAKAAREAAAASSGGRGDGGKSQQPQSHTTQTQTQTPITTWRRQPGSATAAPAPLGGLERPPPAAVDYNMALDPALAAADDDGADHSIRPRLITDMILSESSAHTLSTSASPAPYTRLARSIPTIPVPAATTTTTTTTRRSAIEEERDLDRKQREEALRARGVKRRTEVLEMPPPPFDFDLDLDALNGGGGGGGGGMAEALFAWPDVSFDMMHMHMPTAAEFAAPGPGGYDAATTTDTGGASTGPMTAAGEGPMATDPALSDASMMMNWSTWDEFVLDTLTPKSGSGGSDGS